MWCEKNGFLYAKGLIPKEWLMEPAKDRGFKFDLKGGVIE